jgi:hypothetical protein
MSCPRCSLSTGTVVPSQLCGLSWICCPGCPVPAVLSRLSCPRWPLLTDLPWLPISLSCPSSPVLAVMFWQSCSLFPVLDALSQLSSLAAFASCPVLAIASWLSYPSCPVPAVLGQQYCPRLSRCCCSSIVSCPDLFCPLCSAQAHLPKLSSLD